MKYLKVIIFVILLGTFSSLLLVKVNQFTSPIIARNQELKLKSSILDALDISYEKENIIETFDNNVRIINKDGLTFYIAEDGAVAFGFHGPGLWGPISGVVGMEPDHKVIRNIKIVHQEETPGLGGRIAEDDFLEQFREREVLPKLIFVPQGKARLANEVDAITGATGTSNALEKLLNETFKVYLKTLGE